MCLRRQNRDTEEPLVFSVCVCLCVCGHSVVPCGSVLSDGSDLGAAIRAKATLIHPTDRSDKSFIKPSISLLLSADARRGRERKGRVQHVVVPATTTATATHLQEPRYQPIKLFIAAVAAAGVEENKRTPAVEQMTHVEPFSRFEI